MKWPVRLVRNKTIDGTRNERDEALTQLENMNVLLRTKFRAFTMQLDPQALTSHMRTIEPSAKVEGRVEGNVYHLEVWTGAPVDEAHMNALLSMMPRPNLT